MTAVLLPRRVLLSRAAVEELARRAGTSLPWPGGGPGGGPGTDRGPTEELRAAGLLDGGGPSPEVLAALELLHAPEVLVELDLALGRQGSYARLHSWQRWRAGCVASASTAGGRVELAWFDDRLWQAELVRGVSVHTPSAGDDPPPHDLRLPHDVVLAAATAVRHGRHDLLSELAARAGVAADVLQRVHAGALGRLQVTVGGAGRGGARTAGLVGWLRYRDGWRALTPYLEHGVPMVGLHPVPPERLGAEVAALAARVRG